MFPKRELPKEDGFVCHRSVPDFYYNVVPAFIQEIAASLNSQSQNHNYKKLRIA
jgi:hypothetical protein